MFPRKSNYHFNSLRYIVSNPPQNIIKYDRTTFECNIILLVYCISTGKYCVGQVLLAEGIELYAKRTSPKQ